MATLRNDVSNYLADKILIGSKVYVEDVQWTDIWVELDLFVLDGFNQDQVKSDVSAAIENFLSYDKQDFGGKITVGDIYRTAMYVEGVDYVDVTTLRTDTTSGVENRIIPTLTIARIHPGLNTTPTDETDTTDEDPYGLVITAYGGLGAT